MTDRKTKPKPGPKEDRLVLDGEWESKLKDAFEKEEAEIGLARPENAEKKSPSKS